MSHAVPSPTVERTEATQLASFVRVAEPVRPRGLKHFLIEPILAGHILRLAMPVVLGMLTQSAVNILDTVMVGRLPKEEANPGQAAIGLALPFMWLVGGFLSAVWVGTQAITSRRAGEGNDQLAGRALANSLLLALFSGILFSAMAIAVTPPLIKMLYNDARMVALGTEYLQIRLVGVLAMVCTFSYKSFFDGIGKTTVFMVAAGVMNILNVVLNYVLIFGFEPLAIRSMGVAGAAWASVIAAYVGLGVMMVWSLAPALVKRYRYYRPHNVSWPMIREIVRLSLPNGLATVVVMIGFSAFNWVVGQVNAQYAVEGNPIIAAANQAVVTIAMVSLMSSLAVGSATATIVSQSLGAKRPFLAECYGWTAVKLWAYIMWAVGAVLFFFPDAALQLINPDIDVINIARVPVQGLAIFQGFVAIAVILAQTLYGVGEAKFVMFVEMFLHLLVMAPLAYLCGLVLDLGLIGVYAGPVVYVAALLTATGWRFHQGGWKHIVI